ncbi:hypothetical protein B0B51_17735 (plasmid) [blood disease bacterium A2-HR MARDI]|uniref:Uncharacterized protein n=2 Tax=Ralstonia syzygii TaxID=28097 RepID=A0A1U9VM86_9RALS|nr:hypothetical protein B0B51_17735 [blood disease bacterium A2-HR MARDI]
MKRLSIWALPARPLLKLRRGHGYEVFSDKIELFCRAGDCDDLPIACRGQNTSSSGWRFICAVSGHTSELGGGGAPPSDADDWQESLWKRTTFISMT